MSHQRQQREPGMRCQPLKASRVLLVLVVLLALLPWQWVAAAAPGGAASRAEAEWRALRSMYPYHLQIVGISEPYADGGRTLIVAEPPPHLDRDYFRLLADSVGGEYWVKSNPIGYDGWASDIVMALPPLPDAKLQELLSTLQLDLFGTTYKAVTAKLPLPLPPAQAPAAAEPLDFTVSVADLHQWLIAEDLRFAPLGGGAETSLPEILAAGEPGVFMSATPGFVVWTVPRGQDFADYAVEARQFFLDSDLILGALADREHVAIIGRERKTSTLLMPPLRMESALLLAADTSGSLAQSYERTHAFAGKLVTKQDWAPIYLSRLLLNSEFGSLLNLTDQMLKSWSLDGAVQYINFDYPHPSSYPPFPRPLKEIVDEYGSLLFNWNTAGLGYATTIGDYEYLALQRTGALPITYEAGTAPVKAEEQIAYDYFAALNNPDLARVVQYTALYQIFREFGISTPEPATMFDVDKGTAVLADEAQKFLQAVSEISAERLDELVVGELRKQLYADLPSVLQRAIGTARAAYRKGSDQADSVARATKALADNPDLLPVIGIFGVEDSVREFRQDLARGLALWPGDALTTLAQAVAAPKEYQPLVSSKFDTDLFQEFKAAKTATLADLTPTEQEDLKAAWVLDMLEILGHGDVAWILGGLYFDIDSIEERYVDALNGPVASWIKTPSIVLSQNVDDSATTGGHNLDSAITTLEPSSEVPPGQVKRIMRGQQQVLLYNPADLPHVHQLSRVLAMEGDSPQLTDKLAQTLQAGADGMGGTVNRTVLTGRPADAERGLASAQEPPLAAGVQIGWQRRNAALTDAESEALRALDANGYHGVIVRHNTEGYEILEADGAIATHGHDLTTLHEALKQVIRASGAVEGRQLQFYLDGFSPAEMKMLFLTAGFQIAAGEGMTASERAAQAQERYDWSQATLQNAPGPEITVGPFKGYQTVNVVVTAPAVAAQKPPIYVRIMVAVKRMTGETSAAVVDAIRRVMGSSRPKTVYEITRDLRAELEKTHPGAGIMFRIEAEDSYISRAAPERRAGGGPA